MSTTGGTTGVGGPTPRGPTPRGDVLHVLVVEDDPEINELVGAYARLAGFGYRAALNGDAALTEVRRRRPDVIVLDLMLPDLDGFEICRRIKANAETRDVPVIILTALDNEQARAKGREVGADEYLTKPFDPDRLMRSLNQFAK